MPDQSMKAWHIRLNCDAEGHVKTDPKSSDFESDWETKREGIRQAKRDGWVFHRNGKLTCPECAKAITASPEALPSTKGLAAASLPTIAGLKRAVRVAGTYNRCCREWWNAEDIRVEFSHRARRIAA